MRYSIFIAFLAFLSCSDHSKVDSVIPTFGNQEKGVFQEGSVYVDNEYDGARLNGFKRVNDSTYQVLSTPENTPINNSPWFGFRIWSEQEMDVNLEIAYSDDFKNRYIPKVSIDGLSWKALEESAFETDTTTGIVNLKLSLSPDKLWISAQENINSSYVEAWLDSLAEEDFIVKETVGQSVLGKPIHLLKINDRAAKPCLILIGRQHPTEVPGGTFSLMSFVHTLLSDSELAVRFREQFDVVMFPLLNPDGVDNGNWRHNANGVDLNRDWIIFDQPETKAVRDWVINSRKNYRKEYCFGIDFHTSYSGPYLLTLDTIPHKVADDITHKWIDRIQQVSKDTLDIRPRAQSLPYCYNWMINEVGVEAVTWEEGDEIDREVVRERAEKYTLILMEILLDKYSTR